MRESCNGCVHYRPFAASAGLGLKGCNYAQDMPGLRNTDPSECHSNGKYARKDSKEGKKRMAERSREAWEYSTGHLGRGLKNKFDWI